MKRKKYKKIGGGTLTLADGRTVKSGQSFYEYENRIPKAFSKLLQVIGEEKETSKKPASSDSDETPTVTSPANENKAADTDKKPAAKKPAAKKPAAKKSTTKPTTSKRLQRGKSTTK